MKLILSSNGLSNKKIINSLLNLNEKKPENTTVVFIPTASNNEIWDKKWLINDLLQLKKLNFKSIEITDISAVSEKIWIQSFEKADILFFEWGDTIHLMKYLEKINWIKNLSKLFENKIYFWSSAGSIVACPHLFFEENMLKKSKIKGLNFVDFYFLPHFKSSFFNKISKKNMEIIAKKLDKTIYAVDDNSAIKIIDNKIEIIWEWKSFVFNEKN